MAENPTIPTTAPSTMDGFQIPDPTDETSAYRSARTAGVREAQAAATGTTPRRLNVNQLGLQDKYDFTYRVFPEDLGTGYYGHYVVININVPTVAAGLGGPTAPPAGAFQSLFTPLEQNSKVDELRRFDNLFNPVTGAGINSSPVALPRFTRRIAESIALFMPQPMVYNTHNVYEDISLSALAGRLSVSGLANLSAYLRARGAGTRAAQRRAAAVVGILGVAGTAYGAASKLLASPVNPSVEILFSNTLQRAFTFEFLMAPKNARESLAIKEIIKTLRFHGAPEINPVLPINWIAPAEFDITFFYKGQENVNIPRINTCVMERIEVDYAPSGVFSTFSNGHPVTVRLSMTFREVEPIHKKRVLQGF